ncbi:MAG: class I SAM-dependent methyltransferase, partial [Chlorobiales bacterium]|nr:class I SAM-dependent methyltransferase [Chlorobiales bacterium]
KIEIVKKIVPKGKFLDYGASWGYATYQFGQAGYDAMGFELSVPRGGYAKSKLGVNMLNDFSQLNSYKGNFDIVFSSHVIEHVPVPKDLFNTFSMLLKPGGMMIAFVPNCNNMKRMLGAGFGMHHILALDKSFFQNTLSSHGFGKVTFSSSPYNLEEIKADVDKGYSSKDPDGDELMIIAFKK